MCLFIPMRSHIRWISPTWGSSNFLVVTALAGPPFSNDITVINSTLLFILIFLALYGSYQNEAHARERWKARRMSEIQAIALDKGQGATARILNRFCDCLVLVDQEMEISDPNRLASMLLMTDGDARLKGKPFFDFVA